jgi:hypothetical protein
MTLLKLNLSREVEMPVTVREVDGFQVSTPGGVKAKRTSKIKAERQARLLKGIEHGWQPTGKPASRQEGGPVEAGKPYLVGEKGPEVMVPKTPGTIKPLQKVHVDDSIKIKSF